MVLGQPKICYKEDDAKIVHLFVTLLHTLTKMNSSAVASLSPEQQAAMQAAMMKQGIEQAFSRDLMGNLGPFVSG